MKKTLLLVSLLVVTAAMPVYAADEDSGDTTPRATTDHGLAQDASSPTTQTSTRMHDHGDRGGMMADHWFKKMDSNGDGKVTKAEYDAFNKKKFDEMDANHDGSLTLNEIKAYMTKEHDQWKQKHDAATPSSK